MDLEELRLQAELEHGDIVQSVVLEAVVIPPKAIQFV